ncbi:hypothetical protein Lqui_0067 [Legionella quinlivanii]|uniref:DUF5624 domain-containing protein n=1 Tax=Legionella quinlivanii TaxID=45073 RepID=A0A0W0Y7L1_9GAMM|nr:DUF5624 domain-containing protein [Legionella quinlivanii]KTD52614.1 hypothetical protein Lqui_0067 [Legionella quinlivanii]SEG26388.1 hypothetical protein SAMN02746093_02359 [Legionella quinlivanii DSM 21216]STY10294.1 Uncharacterised protein [Legionella quinlivanii]
MNIFSVKKIASVLLLLFLYTGLANAYTVPKAFMDLYFDFTGTNEPDFPKKHKTISQYLLQSETAKNKTNPFAGPLVLVLDSSIYIYDKNRKLLFKKLLRTNRASGFYELTAISHIGPALAYLAKIKENGDPSWQPAMNSLLANIKRVRALNASIKNNWLERANIKPWQHHIMQIRAMTDYALSMAGNYIVSVQKGAPFDLRAVQTNFLNGNKEYPISYNTVMVGTFMLTALESMSVVHDDIAKLKLDWPHAMVIVRNVAGNNVTSGLTEGSNWMVAFINAVSENTLPRDRLFIAPYAKVIPEVGQSLLPESAYNYYVKNVWGSVYNRTHVAKAVFTNLETIYLPERPAIPGDFHYSSANDIIDFMVRLKHSLQDSREMLSNTVGYWMAGELQSKAWDLKTIQIPGLTTGFPEGVTAYPEKNPEIGSTT